MKGERLVARVHAHPRSMGPKMDSPSLRYFGLPSAQPLRLALVDSTVLSRFFPLLLPLPTAAAISSFFTTTSSSTIMPKPKATAEELEVRAESKGYKRGAHQERDSARDDRKHKR